MSQLGQDSSGSIVTWHTVEAGRVLGSGCHYLAGSDVYAGNSWAVPRDARSVYNGINDNSGIALVRPDGSIADQVGMRSNTIYREGTPLAAFNFNSGRSSYTRMAPDTDNNAADFQFGRATPENASSSCAIR